MKVLMVSRPLLAAAYRQKLTELAALGVDVVAVVPDEWREGGSVVRFESGHSGPYTLVTSPVRWSGRFHVHYFPGLPRLIDAHAPDLVHVDEEPYNLATYLAVRSAGAAGARSIFFTWQNILRRYPPPFSLLERQVYDKASLAIAGSREAASVLRAKGFRKEIALTPQFGVDPQVFSPGRCAKSTFTVGFLNRLIPAKAPLMALEAFARLPSDSHLVVVGDGPMRGELKATIAAHGLQDRVEVLPRVPSGHVPDILRSLHAVVLPSLTTPTWKEQFGRVLIEAMACEVPVVGSSSGEIPEVIGDAGLVVPEGNVGALAGALQRLYEDEELRTRLGMQGRQRVLQHFTHARIARLTHEAYARTLEL